MLRKPWRVTAVDMHPWPRCGDNRRVISRHRWRWLATQAKELYNEHEANRRARLGETAVPIEYAVEKAEL